MKIVDMSVELIDRCGDDLSVVNAARVSFAKESDWEVFNDENDCAWDVLSEKDTKLINYLAKHNHKSPFNHCFLSFHVKAPIFVARQLVKHEYLPWNEVSRRYVDDEPEFWFPKEWRGRVENVKQGSSNDVIVPDKAFDPLNVAAVALMSYNKMLQDGIAPEQARMILPQNTMTEWIWSGTLFAFVKMCKLRRDTHAQQETREVTEHIAGFIEHLFPVSFKALMEN